MSCQLADISAHLTDMWVISLALSSHTDIPFILWVDMSDRYRIFPQRGFDKEYSLLVRCADNCSRTLLVHVNSFTNSHALRRRICSSFAHVWLGLSFLLPTAMLIYSMHLRLMLLRYLFWQREYMCDLLAARDRYCSLGFHIGGWHTQEQRGGWSDAVAAEREKLVPRSRSRVYGVIKKRKIIPWNINKVFYAQRRKSIRIAISLH